MSRDRLLLLHDPTGCVTKILRAMGQGQQSICPISREFPINHRRPGRGVGPIQDVQIRNPSRTKTRKKDGAEHLRLKVLDPRTATYRNRIAMYNGRQKMGQQPLLRQLYRRAQEQEMRSCQVAHQ